VNRAVLAAALLLCGCDPFPLQLEPPHDARHVRREYTDEGRHVELNFIATDAAWAIGVIETQLRAAGYERCAKPGAWRKERMVASIAAEGARVAVRQVREGAC
jgi:hypothetical protein